MIKSKKERTSMYTCCLSKSFEGTQQGSNPIPIFTFSSSKSPQNAINWQEFKDPPTNFSSIHAEKQKWWTWVQKIGILRAVKEESDENCEKKKRADVELKKIPEI